MKKIMALLFTFCAITIEAAAQNWIGTLGTDES